MDAKNTKRTTFNIQFFLKKGSAKKDGSLPIVGRISSNGERTHFSTKIDIMPDFWSVDATKAIGKSNQSNEINSTLDSIKVTMTKIYRELLEKEISVTADKVKNQFFGQRNDLPLLLELFKRHNEEVHKLVGITKTKATEQKYNVTLKHLTNFIEKQYQQKDIHFNELNHQFITDFETYLLTDAACNPNTTAKFLQFFKRIIIIAKNNGWMNKDPFANFKITLKKVDRGYLTMDEIKTIMKKKFPTARLEQIRDIFVFACFTGMAYIDVHNLREEHIKKMFDEGNWIVNKRVKTGVMFNIPLLNVAEMIINKYKGTLKDGRVLPTVSNQKTNSYLKEIADVCGINKNLTFHLARHTFATTITLGQGVPIETVSKMLGHTNIKTTQIYARITDSKINEDMNNLANKLNRKKLSIS